jgi:hypothetical protein
VQWHHGVLASALRNSDVIIGATNSVSNATISAWIVRALDPIHSSPPPINHHAATTGWRTPI